jgi:hypothetical protein
MLRMSVRQTRAAAQRHETKADARRQEEPTFFRKDCEIFAARGHVFIIVDGKAAGQCDKGVLQRVLEKVSSRIGG